MAPPPPTRTSSFAQVAMALAAESQSITSFEVSDHKNRILNTDGTNPSAEQQQQEPRSVTATVQSPREGRAVCILRIAIVAILVVAAVLYSVKVYFYTSVRDDLLTCFPLCSFTISHIFLATFILWVGSRACRFSETGKARSYSFPIYLMFQIIVVPDPIAWLQRSSLITQEK